MTLVRLLVYGWVIYLFYLLAFPDWQGASFHVASVTLLVGSAVLLYMLLSAISATIVGTMLFEMAWCLAAFLYIGWYMPQKSGKSPIQLLAEGHRPNQAAAREGVERLRLNPESKPAQFVINLFPRR